MGRRCNDSIPKSDGQALERGSMNKIPSPISQITQQQLETYLWGAATLLRGVIDAGDYKQYIFPLLFFKRICDVYDEEFQRALDESEGDVDYAAFAENHRFQIPEGSHWRDVRNQASNVGSAIQKAMREIEQANPR